MKTIVAFTIIALSKISCNIVEARQQLRGGNEEVDTAGTTDGDESHGESDLLQSR